MPDADRERALTIARAILDGSMPILLGCRRIVGPIARLGLDRESPFTAFVGLESETDHLPIDPEERMHWDPQVLMEKDRQIESFTRHSERLIRETCEAVIKRLADVSE